MICSSTSIQMTGAIARHSFQRGPRFKFCRETVAAWRYPAGTIGVEESQPARSAGYGCRIGQPASRYFPAVVHSLTWK